MQSKLQLDGFRKEVDKLQKIYGDSRLHAVYGAGCIKSPKVLLLFMNPTATNVSACLKWKGLVAPWLGTKNIWKLLSSCNLLDNDIYMAIKNGKTDIWTDDFAVNVYSDIKKHSVYITNLAKCTQIDARKLKDDVFKEYLLNTLEEIYEIQPNKIISFGNQVSSILLNKKVSVSNYVKQENEILIIKDRKFKVYPCYYPVGQGMRNMDKAVGRIKEVLS